VAEFRVIDPPIVSQKPVAPNRVMLLALAFVVALGAGVFASFAVSQIYPTIHDARGLREAAGRPVLGAVTMLRNSARRWSRRRRHLAFAGALGSLFAVYGAAIVLLTVGGRWI
jgi:hypothetical protein